MSTINGAPPKRPVITEARVLKQSELNTPPASPSQRDPVTVTAENPPAAPETHPSLFWQMPSPPTPTVRRDPVTVTAENPPAAPETHPSLFWQMPSPRPAVLEARITKVGDLGGPAAPAAQRDPLVMDLDLYGSSGPSSDVAKDMLARAQSEVPQKTMSPLWAARMPGVLPKEAPTEKVTVGSRTYEVVMPENLAARMKDLHPDWQLKDDRTLERTFNIKGFKKPIAFANELATVANQLKHHPDLHIKWGELKVEITTHDIDRGLTVDDLKLAKAIDGVKLPE